MRFIRGNRVLTRLVFLVSYTAEREREREGGERKKEWDNGITVVSLLENKRVVVVMLKGGLGLAR